MLLSFRDRWQFPAVLEVLAVLAFPVVPVVLVVPDFLAFPTVPDFPTFPVKKISKLCRINFPIYWHHYLLSDTDENWQKKSRKIHVKYFSGVFPTKEAFYNLT